MAESAVKLLIQNLIPLLAQEATLLEGIHDKIADINSELESIQSFLKDADARAEMGDMSAVAKTWVKQRGERYGFNFLEQGGPSNDVRHDTWHDPRVASLFLEEAEVVGIDSPKAELIEWLVEGPFNRMVISIVGIGGLGKTTLVKKVYENEKVVAHFDCCAWITVSQSYKMEELLRHMIRQFYQASEESASTSIESIDKMKETELIEEVRFWGYIKHVLPNNGKGGRIIITTRSESVAPTNKESPSYDVHKLSPLPLEKAYELFCKKVFQCESGDCPLELVELSHLIIERCEGLPLALEVIGGLLSTKEKSAFEWRKFLDSLSSELQSNPHLLSITKILSLSYFDLPYNLKACFLYLGMFLEDYFINCARLIRLWIAKGFIKEKQGITLEDVAQDYLKQLIHRSLIQVEHVGFIGRIRMCQVHDMMCEVILSRSEDLGFHLVSIQNYSRFDRIARRLSIRNNVDTPLKCFTSSKTCSILILGVDQVPNAFLTTCFVNFKLKKIMDFEGAPINHITKEVGNLFHLRYLSLRDTKVQVLPKSIGKLQNLEILDLKRSLVYKLPMEINGL
ncbi:disease resistance protein RPM1-like [Quercus suber]|uniref:disease resistance protein RPM1-like n=1 Tax=Quercus suber TaxID=58331 RepID=UPI0032DF4BD2